MQISSISMNPDDAPEVTNNNEACPAASPSKHDVSDVTSPKSSPRGSRLEAAKKGTVRVADFTDEAKAPASGTVGYWMWKLPLEGVLQDMPYRQQICQLDLLLPKVR